MKKFIKETILKHAKDRQDFYNRLHTTGLRPYTNRQGIVVGIKDGKEGRKYSFQSLGIQPQDLQLLDQRGELNQIKNRLAKLERMRTQGRSREKGREL